MTNKTVSIVIGTYTTPTSFREIKVYKVGEKTHERHQSPHAVR